MQQYKKKWCFCYFIPQIKVRQMLVHQWEAGHRQGDGLRMCMCGVLFYSPNITL